MEKEPFFTLTDGRAASLYTLKRGAMCAKISDWGGTLVELWVPDRDGNPVNVVLSHDDPADYEKNPGFLGALVGRYANRIRGGKFKLNGKNYQIVRNEGSTALHGGDGLSARLWKAEMIDGATLRLTIESPDGDAGFPGRLLLTVVYQLTSDNALQLSYAASSTLDTVVNFTNHAYFNLSGCPARDISDTRIKVKSDMYTEVNKSNIPTGWMQFVQGTPFDLRKMTVFKKCFAKLPRGFDHNFVLKKTSGASVAAVEPSTGIKLEMYTTEPGVQLYTGGFMNRSIKLRGGVTGRPFLGFCLEAQHYPDSPNHPEWPGVVLKAGQLYKQITKYKFDF